MLCARCMELRTFTRTRSLVVLLFLGTHAHVDSFRHTLLTAKSLAFRASGLHIHFLTSFLPF